MEEKCGLRTIHTNKKNETASLFKSIKIEKQKQKPKPKLNQNTKSNHTQTFQFASTLNIAHYLLTALLCV